MPARKDGASAPASRPKTILLVDHPNLIAMEKFRGRSITPARLMSLAKTRGDVVYARVFTDSLRLGDARQSRDWEHAGFYVEYCRRYGRPESERGQNQLATKETVDAALVEYAHRIIPLIRPDQLILVAGDSDYVPLVRSVAQVMQTPVRVFLTGPCGLMEPLLAETVLAETYALYDAESPAEMAVIPLFQRMQRRKDVYYLTPRDKAELDKLSDMLVVCSDCQEQVEIGLWKIHGCHPNPAPVKTQQHIPAVTVDWESPIAPPQASLLQNGQTQPSPPLSPPPVAEAIAPLDAVRWAGIRNEARAIPRGGIQNIMVALKEASKETSLAWLADDERVSPTSDEISALKRLVEKQVACPVTVWQQALCRIRDELKEALPVLNAERLIQSWTLTEMFDDALALLIDEGVLQVTEQNLLARGSLVRPAFRFAGHETITKAMATTESE